MLDFSSCGKKVLWKLKWEEEMGEDTVKSSQTLLLSQNNFYKTSNESNYYIFTNWKLKLSILKRKVIFFLIRVINSLLLPFLDYPRWWNYCIQSNFSSDFYVLKSHTEKQFLKIGLSMCVESSDNYITKKYWWWW